jgi:hypothetical protein
MNLEASSSFFSIVLALSLRHFAHSVSKVTSYPILHAPKLHSVQWAQYVFHIHVGLHRGRCLSFYFVCSSFCPLIIVTIRLFSSFLLFLFLLFSSFLFLFFYFSPLLPPSYADKCNKFFCITFFLY